MTAQEKPRLKIGGALRFNYNYSDWKPESRNRGGEFDFDVLRLNVNASYKKIDLAVDYRFYPSSSGGGMLREGWIGYRFNDSHRLQIGLTTVPFGVLPYTGNNYFFNLNYYAGLEDDADMGIKYLFRKDRWELSLAYFHNADLSGVGGDSELSASRYAYDIAGCDKEAHQGNVRLTYHFGTRWRHQLGGSVLMGGLYNMDTRKTGFRSAFALHYVADYRRWNLKMQYTNYNLRSVQASGEDRRVVTMAAYGSSYRIASKAGIYTVSLSYRIPVNKWFLDDICLYNDFSLLGKRLAGFNDSLENVNASYKKIDLAVDYRFYPPSSGGCMLREGWIGYRFNDSHRLQIGLTTVPFGILPYTGNNYFFNLNYYAGLEDDADMGIKYLFRKDRWELSLAYFHNADLSGVGGDSELSASRYAYDIAGCDKEAHQGNVRLTYHFGTRWRHQLGGSVLMGGLYNMDTRKTGFRSAFALHYVADYRRWNLKMQYTNYNLRSVQASGEDRRVVTMAAYGSSYRIASKAGIYTVSLSYRIPVNKWFLDDICLYNDFSLLGKRLAGFNDSLENVTGCSLAMGKVFAYIDYAVGRNHAWLGDVWDEAFAGGTEDNWNVRFNINMGYYF